MKLVIIRNIEDPADHIHAIIRAEEFPKWYETHRAKMTKEYEEDGGYEDGELTNCHYIEEKLKIFCLNPEPEYAHLTTKSHSNYVAIPANVQ